MSKKKSIRTPAEPTIEEIMKDIAKERPKDEYKVWSAVNGRWVPIEETQEFWDMLAKETKKRWKKDEEND